LFDDKVVSAWKASEFLELVIAFMNKLNISKHFKVEINYVYYLVYFYATIFLVLLLIIDIIYVTYCFQIKKFSFTWPLYLLRNFTGLFVTVFFLPIMGNIFLKL